MPSVGIEHDPSWPPNLKIVIRVLGQRPALSKSSERASTSQSHQTHAKHSALRSATPNPLTWCPNPIRDIRHSLTLNSRHTSLINLTILILCYWASYFVIFPCNRQQKFLKFSQSQFFLKVNIFSKSIFSQSQFFLKVNIFSKSIFWVPGCNFLKNIF
jgi:hypothetical protein